MECGVNPITWSLLTLGIFLAGYLLGKSEGKTGKFMKDIWRNIRSRETWLDLTEKIRLKKR